MESIILAGIFVNTAIMLSIWHCHNFDMRRMGEDIKEIMKETKKQEDEGRHWHKEACDEIYKAQKELFKEIQDIKHKI